MATDLEDFVPNIQPQVSGCPNNLILNAIRDAAIKFCNETWLIRENLPASDVVLGVDDYTISASSDKDVVGTVSFLYNKRDLDMKTEEELDIIDQGWRTADPGATTYITAPAPDRILLNRVPAETIVDGMIARIATKPSLTATTVDDLLLRDWKDAIKYGALKILFEIPKKGWSDKDLSIWYGKQFNNQIQSGKARAVMGNMKKSTTAKMRSWI